MKNVRFWGVTLGLVLTVLAGLVFLAPTTHGQAVIATTDDDAQPARRVEVLGGRATIGVMVRDVEQKDVTDNKLNGPQGAVVEDVDQGSPAEKAGFKSGDVVTTFDGEKVRSARQFSRLVDETPAGREVRATVMRQGSPVELRVAPGAGDGTRFGVTLPRHDFQFRFPELRAMPDMRAFEGLDEWALARGGAQLGVTVQDLNEELAEYFGVQEGLLVTSVRADSPAAKAGIKVGDVITSVDGAAVDDAAELRRRINQRESDDITLGIVRDKKAETLKATIERPETQPRRQRWPV